MLYTLSHRIFNLVTKDVNSVVRYIVFFTNKLQIHKNEIPDSDKFYGKHERRSFGALSDVLLQRVAGPDGRRGDGPEAHGLRHPDPGGAGSDAHPAVDRPVRGRRDRRSPGRKDPGEVEVVQSGLEREFYDGGSQRPEHRTGGFPRRRPTPRRVRRQQGPSPGRASERLSG